MHKLDGDFFRGLVNLEEGTVDRRIFVDEDIYRLELERIFARTWNFMCHESQIPETGDYFMNFIGEDSVIVVRDKRVTCRSCSIPAVIAVIPCAERKWGTSGHLYAHIMAGHMTLTAGSWACRVTILITMKS
ncbi:MAG: hypothetical protein R3C55_05305 [Parvularculaceae bacterium]